MHARNRTWLLGSDPVERCRQRTMNVEGGDGSTLSLDFTTGVLDPRLTFTRTTNATFINSQGYVQYADANLILNSTMLVSTTWTATTSGGGTVTINDDNTVTFASTAGRATWLQSVTIQSGLPVTFSIEVTALTNTNIRVSDLFQAGTGFTSQVYNYTDLSGNTTANIGAFTTLPGIGLYTVNANTTATSGNVIFGTDCNGVTRTGNVTIARPQFQYGTRVSSRVYLANSSTSAANTNTARFDYDPTAIGTPRGLLIEGQANNLTKYSEDLSQISGVNQWYGANMNTPTVPGGAPNSPYGTTAASWKLVATAGAGFHVWRYGASFTAADYTFSFWAKAAEYDRIVLSDVGSGRGACSFVLNGNGTATAIAGTVTPTNPLIVPYANGWYRCSVTITMTAATYGIGIAGYPVGTTLNAFGASYTADGTSGVYATMFQTELGSGASSYIPTGASQGSRAYDHCYATGANFTSWFSVGAGTMVVVSDNIKSNVQNLAAMISDDSTSNYVRMGFKVGGAANEYLLTTVGGAFQGSADSGYAPSLNTVYRMAYAWDTNNFGIVANGGAVGTDLSGTVAGAGVLNRLVVGGDFVAVPNDIYFKNGHIKSLKYWPIRLPNAQLQSLTT